ncbi:hypothetical protein C2S51_029622 [Perilla frutescens var. frutescens]|nr:hypothetical protein C2S51_029622 [Perilla frutescens var. frutescens]
MKSKTTGIPISAKSKKGKKDSAGASNAAVLMPTTPTVDRELTPSAAQRPQENSGGGGVATESPQPPEERGNDERERAGVRDLGDIMDDLSLSGLWEMEIDSGPGPEIISRGMDSLEVLMEPDSWKWDPEIHEDSWIWDDHDSKWGADEAGVDVGKHDALLSWLMS